MDHGVCGTAHAGRRGATSAFSGRLFRGGLRAPQLHRPSRSEAGQHPRRYQRRAEARGLRHLQAARRERTRRRHGGAADDAQLCQSRADSRRGRDHRVGHLLAWRRALRAAHRPLPAAFRQPRADGDRAQPRASDRAAERGRGRRSARPAACRRSRQHPPARARDGSGAAIRVGRPARRRSAPPSGAPAGARAAADARLSRAILHPPPSRRHRRGRRDLRGADHRHDRVALSGAARRRAAQAGPFARLHPRHGRARRGARPAGIDRGAPDDRADRPALPRRARRIRRRRSTRANGARPGVPPAGRRPGQRRRGQSRRSPWRARAISEGAAASGRRDPAGA